MTVAAAAFQTDARAASGVPSTSPRVRAATRPSPSGDSEKKAVLDSPSFTSASVDRESMKNTPSES